MKIEEMLEKFSTSPAAFEEVQLIGAMLAVEETYINEDGTEGVHWVDRKLGKIPKKGYELLNLMALNPHIKKIILKDQDLNSYHSNVIAEILKNSGLTLINLEKNPLLFSFSVENLFSPFFYFLGRSTSVVTLNMKKCMLGTTFLTNLGEALKANKSLQYLYLGKKHQFSIDAFEYFVKALESNTTLMECDIDIRTIHFIRRFSVRNRLQNILARNCQLYREPTHNNSNSFSSAPFTPAIASSTSQTSTEEKINPSATIPEDAEAQYQLGYKYSCGQGVTVDDKQAFICYEKAANYGHTDAQCRLGFMYTHGRGVAKDDTQAFKWFERAANQGHIEAQQEVEKFLSARKQKVRKNS
jgi:hypothetical protein